jgi:E3 SUMO-protein ligase RanBP2
MSPSRIEALQAMRQRNPDDTRVLFALAAELEKEERWLDVVATLREYLERADDQGNAWGRLSQALVQLGDRPEARVALTRGIEAAQRHGHPGMAAEFEEALEQLDD